MDCHRLDCDRPFLELCNERLKERANIVANETRVQAQVAEINIFHGSRTQEFGESHSGIEMFSMGPHDSDKIPAWDSKRSASCWIVLVPTFSSVSSTRQDYVGATNASKNSVLCWPDFRLFIFQVASNMLASTHFLMVVVIIVFFLSLFPVCALFHLLASLVNQCSPAFS